MNFTNISKKQILMLIAAVIIAAAIPLTVFISQKQQELRQRAAPNSTKFFFTDISGSSINNFSTPVKTTGSFKLFLLPATAINGFDITVSGDNNLQIARFDGAATEFNQTLVSSSSLDTTSNTARFSKVSNDTTKAINSQVLLGTINVKPLDNAVAGTKGTITITNSAITSSLQPTGYVDVDAQSLTLPYTISALPPTPTPTPISYRKEDGTIVPNISLPPGRLIALNFKGVTLPGIDSKVGSADLKLTFFRGDNTNSLQQIPGGPFTANVARGQLDPTVPKDTFSGRVVFPASTLGLPTNLQDYFIQIGVNSYQAKILGNDGTKARRISDIQSQGLTDLIPVKIYSSGADSTIPIVGLLPGDINGDGIIDVTDLGVIVACFGKKNVLTDSAGRTTDCSNKTQNGKFNADIDKNGSVDGIDINLWSRGANGII